MSPCLFNIFFDRVVRHMNKRGTGRRVKLTNRNGGGEKLSKCRTEMTILVTDTREHFQFIANEFEGLCDNISMGLKINVGQNKVLEIK